MCCKTHNPSISAKETNKSMNEIFRLFLHCFQLISHGLQLPSHPVTKVAHAVTQTNLLLLKRINNFYVTTWVKKVVDLEEFCGKISLPHKVMNAL